MGSEVRRVATAAATTSVALLRTRDGSLARLEGVPAPQQNGAGQTGRAAVNGHTPASVTNGHCNGRSGAAVKQPVAEDVKVLGAARADLIRAAQRVGKVKNMKVSEVVDGAAKGAFRFADLQRLNLEALPALRAAIEILRQVE